MEEFLAIGKITRTHGVKGEVKVEPLTDDPQRFKKLKTVFLERDGVLQKYAVERVKFFKQLVILKLAGIDDMNTAETLKGLYLKVDRENAVKLPEYSYFICDLIGCTVVEENGGVLGILAEVLQAGSNDVYLVKGKGGKEILIPALKSVVKRVAPEEKEITVSLPKGLMDNEV